MPLLKVKAEAKLLEGVKVKAKARNFEVTADEPEELGGTDTAMNPVELLLCSLGACQSIAARTFAKKLGVNFKDFWVEVEGELNTDGFMGKEGVRPGFSEIRYHFHIDTEEPREKVEKFVKYLEEHCPVGDSLANGVTLKLASLNIEGSQQTP